MLNVITAQCALQSNLKHILLMKYIPRTGFPLALMSHKYYHLVLLFPPARRKKTTLSFTSYTTQKDSMTPKLGLFILKVVIKYRSSNLVLTWPRSADREIIANGSVQARTRSLLGKWDFFHRWLAPRRVVSCHGIECACMIPTAAPYCFALLRTIYRLPRYVALLLILHITHCNKSNNYQISYH